MITLMLSVCAALALIRWPRTTSRQADMIQCAGAFGFAGLIIGRTPAGSFLNAVPGLPDASTLLMMNCLLAALWCTRCAIVAAVKGRNASHKAGRRILITSGVICWAVFLLAAVWDSLDPAGTAAQEMSYSTALYFVIVFLYLGLISAEIANWAFHAVLRARTRTVRAGCGLLGLSAAVLSAASTTRAGLGTLTEIRLWAGNRPYPNSARIDEIASLTMQYSGLAAALGLILPSIQPFRAYLKEALWGLRALRRIKPLWQRAAACRGDRLTGINSVSRANPVARLHRCVVEIRDAQLAQTLTLTPRESALVHAAESRLSYEPKEETQ